MEYKDKLNQYNFNTPENKEPVTKNTKVKAPTYEDRLKNSNFGESFSNVIGMVEPAASFSSDTGFGESMFDDYGMSAKEFQEQGIDEIRAQKQPWVAKAGAGVGRALNSFATNVAEIPGFMFGTVGAIGNELFGDGENSMDMIVNNWWSEVIKEEQDWFNNDAMPVYVKKAVQEGKFWENITSVDFWATEGADAAAFMAAAFTPAAALSAIGTGTKLSSALGKMEGGLNWLKKVDSASKAMGLTNTAGAVDVLGATLVNTLYEAGKEAQGAYEAYDNELNKLLAEGSITESQYTKLQEKKGEQATKVFQDNFGILLIPNLLMSKALFGKFSPTNEAKKFAVKSSGEIIPELAKKSAKSKVVDAVKLVGGMTAQEGLFEEGLQMTSEKYRTEDFIEEQIGGENKSYAERYLDVIGSTEGQKAIFLGGFLGSIAGGVGNYRQKKAEKEQQDALLGILKNGSSLYEASINGIYKRGADGKVEIDSETKEPIVDQKLVGDLTVALSDVATLTEQRDQAIADGNSIATAFYDNEINTNLIKSFVKAGDEGISLMKNFLTHSTGIDTMLDTYNENRAIKVSKDEFINGIGKQAESIKEDYEDFKAYGIHYTGLEEHGKDKYLSSFLGVLENAFIGYKSRDSFLTDQLNKTNKKLRDRKTKIEENAAFLQSATYREGLKAEGVLRSDSEINTEYANATTELQNLEKDEKGVVINKKKEKELNSKIDKLTKEADVVNAEQNKIVSSILADNQYKKLQNESDSLTTYKEENLKQLEDLQNSAIQNAAFLAFKKDLKESEDKIKNGEATEVDDEVNDINKTTNKEELKTAAKKASANKKTSKSSKAYVSKKAKEKKDKLEEEEKEKRKATKLKVEEEGDTDLKGPDNKTFNSKRDGSTEGGTSPENISNENNSKSKKVGKDEDVILHADVPLQDFYETDPNSPYNQWQETPRDKTGDIVEFRVATEYKPEGTQALMDELHTKGLTDNVVNNLPINVIVAPGVFVPVNGKTNTQIWELIDKPFRIKLLQAYLDNNNSFDNISSTIAFQYGGDIQLSPQVNGKNATNKLTSLKGFDNIDNIEIVTPLDVMGTTINDKGVESDSLSSMLDSTNEEEDKSGKIYMTVKTANGKDFPLRVNVRNINQKEAELIADIYTDLIVGEAQPNDLLKEGTLSETTLANIVKGFPNVIRVLGKKNKKLKIKDVLDFFIFEGTKGSTNNIQFDKGNGILVLNKASGASTFSSANIREQRQGIVTWLTENKRHHIKFTKDSRTAIGLANKEYKSYVINNGILNTNAVTDSSLFKGRKDENGKKKAFTFISSNIKAPKPTSKKPTTKNKQEKIRKSDKKTVPSQKVTKKLPGKLGALMRNKNVDNNKDKPETKC